MAEPAPGQAEEEGCPADPALIRKAGHWEEYTGQSGRMEESGDLRSGDRVINRVIG